MAIRLVAFATWGGSPAMRSRGKVMKDPPPEKALMNPPRKPPAMSTGTSHGSTITLHREGGPPAGRHH